tara:strand:+ start:6998 stop:7171 length:174 start_codon:yes stop_codon:yes gene_type:complete
MSFDRDAARLKCLKMTEELMPHFESAVKAGAEILKDVPSNVDEEFLEGLAKKIWLRK